nr:hypothetical protein [Streptomyces sp. SID4950]
MLGIRFLATEYRTGHHGGRIDSLGLDENGAPVIVEYKRNRDQNVISQGLSYLWWLHDHHHEFESLTRGKLGDQAAVEIDWSALRIVCVAGAFTHHDTVAVEMIGHRIDLVTYRVFEDVLTLQLVASAGGSRTSSRGKGSGSTHSASPTPKSVQRVCRAPQGAVRGPRRVAVVPPGCAQGAPAPLRRLPTDHERGHGARTATQPATRGQSEAGSGNG